MSMTIKNGKKLLSPEERERRGAAWAESAEDEPANEGGRTETYRDGSLKNECWNDRNE